MSLSTSERPSQESTPRTKKSRPARRRRFIPPPPTTITPGIYGESDAPFRLFGFALTREFLDEYCTRHNIAQDAGSPRYQAIEKIIDDAGVMFDSTLKTVYLGGFDSSGPHALPNFASCLVLANNKPGRINFIDEAINKRVREAMGVDATPMWYKQM